MEEEEETEENTKSLPYRGIVKRFSKRNGMGFIVCDATFALYSRDVRIFRDTYEGACLGVGNAVAFDIMLDGRPGCPRGSPCATKVVRLPAQPASTEASSDASDAPQQSEREPQGHGDDGPLRRNLKGSAAT